MYSKIEVSFIVTYLIVLQPIDFLGVKLKKQKTSLMQMVLNNNQIACWVTTTILMEEKLEKRAEVLEYMIQLALVRLS